MSKSPIGLGTKTSSRPSRAARREDAARVVPEIVQADAPRSVSLVPEPELPSIPEAPETDQVQMSPAEESPAPDSAAAARIPEPAEDPAPSVVPSAPAAADTADAAAPTAPAPEPAAAEERPATVTDLFEPRKKPGKKPLNTYASASTAARLDWFVKQHGLKTTDVVDTALVRLLDEMGVPQADIHGVLLEN